MNWTINQNCQLIIDDLPTKEDASGNEYTSVVEVIYNKYEDSFWGIVNREVSIEYNLKTDGRYKYLKVLSNRDAQELEHLLLTPNTFLELLDSPIDSIGPSAYEEEIFSICHLRKCAFEHEKKAIEEFLSTCNKRNCNKKSPQQSVRDILLISVFVLENLICKHRYKEAERILESLGSCGNLCDNISNKTCCCNG